MKSNMLVEDGWMLVTPDDEAIKELMRWLPDARSVDIWSGPRFRYPFTYKTFCDDSRVNEILSFCLRNPEGVMTAFGQVYDRYDRGHLARLITHPGMRRKGIGKRLIGMLIRATQRLCGHSECSLFVYRHNEAAYCCYLSMGFVLQDYPRDAPMEEQCYFLTRATELRDA